MITNYPEGTMPRNAQGVWTPLANPPASLQRLYDERQSCVDFVDQTVAGANVEGQQRDLSTTEQETLTRQRERITALDAQISPLEDFEQLRSAGNAAASNYRPTQAGTPQEGGAPLGARTEPVPHHYRSRGHVMVDQLRALGSVRPGDRPDSEARQRLISAGAVFEGMTPEEFQHASAAQARAVDRYASQERAVNITTDTPGVMPTPIVGQIMSDLDASRPFITSMGVQAMDSIPGKTFSRPVVTQHTAAGKQTTEGSGTGIGSQKLTIDGVDFTKETWGNYLEVSRQEIDWTSPSAWNAILTDMDEIYGNTTENAAADAFATAVAAGNTPVEVGGTGAASTLKDYITALYAAAALVYPGAGRLPDGIWMSLDQWATLGPLIEAQVSTNQQPGSSSVGSFVGDLLKLPRHVVPSFPTGTLIIGASKWSEVYEERLGLLQAVKPSTLGVEIAVGGYIAYNTLKATAFCSVVNAA
ncbi:MAG TPA: hypothetical protein VFH76_25790 [Kribbella sp.]|nr:hypothetical protein [Kribbella sp.]